MTPGRPDAGVIERRLRAIQEALRDLDHLAQMDPAALGSESIRRAAGERLIQVAVDQAVDINAHLVTSVLGEAPVTARQSFTLAARAGILSSDLADELAPATGLRNVLVHRYVDIDVGVVETSIRRLLQLLPHYIREVAAFVASLEER